MKMTFGEVAMLRYDIDMEGAKRIEELDRFMKERETRDLSKIKEE
jgi:hypothetical protein